MHRLGRIFATFAWGAFLLHGPLGCAVPTDDQQEPLAPFTARLEQRPSNPTCVAGAGASVPERLSQLGCFDRALQPLPGLISYDVVAPAWSEDADKQRWLALPDGTTMRFDADGHVVLPIGTVLLKQFSRAGQKLETRVWLNQRDAGWQGYSYRWAPDGSDAQLAAEAGDQVPIGSGPETWSIPGRGQCTQCHQPGPNHALGLQRAQLDLDFSDPDGTRANQLSTWTAIGVLEREAAPAVPTARLVDYRDQTQPLDARARSYLHANCSSCHNAAQGFCTGDLRIGTPASQLGLCGIAPKLVDPAWGWPTDSQLIAPGAPERSALWLRLSAPGDADMAMPPVGRTQVHAAGVELIADWISAMPGCATAP